MNEETSKNIADLDKKIIDKLKESAKLNINKIETYEQPKNDDEAVMVDKEVIVD